MQNREQKLSATLSDGTRTIRYYFATSPQCRTREDEQGVLVWCGGSAAGVHRMACYGDRLNRAWIRALAADKGLTATF